MAASIAVMVMLVVLDGVAWKIRDLTIDTPTRLEHVIRCLSSENHSPLILPARRSRTRRLRGRSELSSRETRSLSLSSRRRKRKRC